MAIKLERDVGGSGVTAEFWVLSSIHHYREGNTEVFSASAQYDLYLNEAAFQAGRAPIRRSAAQVVAREPVPEGTAVDALGALFDQLAVAPEVPAVLEDSPTEDVSGAIEEGATPAPRRMPEPMIKTPAVPAGPLAGGEIID